MERKHGSRQEELEQMIEDCEARQEKMTEWEQNFIDSVSHQIGHGKSLSGRQEQTLERIWNKVTS